MALDLKRMLIHRIRDAGEPFQQRAAAFFHLAAFQAIMPSIEISDAEWAELADLITAAAPIHEGEHVLPVD